MADKINETTAAERAGTRFRTRRRFLQGAGATSISLATTPLLAQKANAQSQGDPPPAMRSQRSSGAAGTLGSESTPPLPPLEVIALNRMAFGPRPGDFKAFRDLGPTDDARLQAYVEQQTNPSSIDDSECEARLASFTTLNKSLKKLWDDHIRGDMGSSLPASEVRRATFLRAVYSKRQLVEVLADHWHNHFNVYAWDWPQSAVFVHYDRDVIRKHLFGNFRTMVEEVAKSPAMLYYLDNQSSTGDQPNENFSRELHELHVMGAENYYGVRALDDPEIFDDQGKRKGYIDEDVYGATTCFTGWRFNEETAQFEFDNSRHFPYQKFHMGRVLPSFQGIQDGRDVLDAICSHPGAARYICRRLCRRLVSDNPPDSLVQAAADVFLAHRDKNDQLKRVVRTILLSPEFRTTWGEKVKRPFEFVVSLLRASNADFEPNDSFLWDYGQTGQGLFEWRPPDGYPDTKEAWSSTMPMLQRWRRVNWLLRWTYGGDGPNRDKPRIDLLSQMPKNRTTPVQIADFWIQRILGRPMPDVERQAVVNFMAHGRNPEFDLPSDQIAERLPHMVSLIFLSPSFHWR